MNQCRHTEIYPSQLKLSRAKPLFKSGDFERVVFDQLLGYFTNNNLLCLDQFGFRPGYSTELAALRLVDHLITQMDS